jgi:hypothetical protein
VDATTKKLYGRMAEIELQRSFLKRELDAINTALAVAGVRPPGARHSIRTTEESDYLREQPFVDMSLTDACLKILKDHAEKDDASAQWLDKNQVEYMARRGGYQFETNDSTNSVNVTLRRLAAEEMIEAHGGKGSRPIKYHFRRDREPML